MTATARAPVSAELEPRGPLTFAATLAVLLIAAGWFGFVLVTYYFGQHSLSSLLAELRHGIRASLLVFGGIPAHLISVLEAALFFAAAGSVGWRLLTMAGIRFDNAAEGVAFSTGLGLGLFALLTLLLGALGLLYPLVFWVLLAAGVASLAQFWTPLADGIRHRRVAPRRALPPIDWLSALAILVILYLLYGGVLIAGSPEQTRDAVTYHLAGPQLWASAHRIFNLLPQYGIWRAEVPVNQEMLYTAGLLLDPHWATLSRLFHTGEGALLVVAMAGFSRWLFDSGRPGWVAGTAFLATPSVSFELGFGLNDVAVTLFAMLCAAALVRWIMLRLEGQRALGWLALAGAFGGLTYGFKATAVVVALAAGAVAVGAALLISGKTVTMRERARDGLIAAGVFGGCALALMLPWLIRSAVNSGNPIYPIADSLFHSPWWSAAADQANLRDLAASYGVGHSPTAVLASLWNLTFLNDRFEGVIGPVFLAMIPLAPILCWANRRWLGRRIIPLMACWVVGLAAFLFWALSISEARFAFPALALMLLPAVCAAFSIQRRWPALLSSTTLVILLGIGALSLPGFQPWHLESNSPGGGLYWPSIDLNAAFGRETLDEFFVRRADDYWYPWSVITYINTHLAKPSTRILSAGPPSLPYFYLDPSIAIEVTNYELIRPHPPIDIRSPQALEQMKAAGVTELYVDTANYQAVSDNPSLAGHYRLLTHTTGPANPGQGTPMSLLELIY